MKKVLLYTLGLLLLLSACSDEETEPYIAVRGSATVKMPVNYLKFRVGLSKTGEELQPLVKESYQTMLDIKHLLLDDWNIPDSMITTNESSVRKYRRSDEVFYGFEQSMIVKLDSLKLYETLRRDLIKAGASEAAITHFGNFDQNEYREKARQEALKNALKKAEALASSMGLSVGKPNVINMGTTYINLDADFDLNEMIRTPQSKIYPPAPTLESTLLKKFKKVESDVSVKFNLNY